MKKGAAVSNCTSRSPRFKNWGGMVQRLYRQKRLSNLQAKRDNFILIGGTVDIKLCL